MTILQPFKKEWGFSALITLWSSIWTRSESTGIPETTSECRSHKSWRIWWPVSPHHVWKQNMKKCYCACVISHSLLLKFTFYPRLLNDNICNRHWKEVHRWTRRHEKKKNIAQSLSRTPVVFLLVCFNAYKTTVLLATGVSSQKRDSYWISDPFTRSVFFKDPPLSNPTQLRFVI